MRDHKQHRRHFDHDADTRRGDRIAQHLFHFASGALNQLFCVVNLVDVTDHRQQDTEVAGGSIGTQHRAHLHQENFRLVERQADAAPAQAGILFTDRHIGQLFVCPHIQRSQRYRLVVEQLQHALILRHLLLFRREAILQHKRDFGAVEADAIHPAAQRLLMFRT